MDFNLLSMFGIAFLALIAGAINTIAGAGSNLVVPALILFGLPAEIANATNRVGIIAQSSSALAGFKHYGKFDTSDLGLILIPIILGGLAGASAIANINTQHVKYVILGAMILMACITYFKPQTVLPPEGTQIKKMRNTPLAWPVLFFVGFYGGLVQAGVGFLLIGAIAGNLRYDILKTNALKHLCMLGFTFMSLAVFIWYDLIDWLIGLVLSVGYIIGAQIGVKLAVKASPSNIKTFLFYMTIVACIAALIS